MNPIASQAITTVAVIVGMFVAWQIARKLRTGHIGSNGPTTTEYKLHLFYLACFVLALWLTPLQQIVIPIGNAIVIAAMWPSAAAALIGYSISRSRVKMGIVEHKKSE